jgi:hypothetical protein
MLTPQFQFSLSAAALGYLPLWWEEGRLVSQRQVVNSYMTLTPRAVCI